MKRVLLEGAKEERLVLPNRSSHSETINVMAENGFWRVVQLIHIRNRVEAMRLKAPQQRSVQAVRSGLGNDVEDSSSSAAELDAKIACLHGDLLDGVGDVERLCDARERNVIIGGAVQ